jgi:hypothetical protein
MISRLIIVSYNYRCLVYGVSLGSPVYFCTVRFRHVNKLTYIHLMQTIKFKVHAECERESSGESTFTKTRKD